jgi:hypothetical protein
VVTGRSAGFAPRIGGYVVAVWLWAIIVNLLFVTGLADRAPATTVRG